MKKIYQAPEAKIITLTQAQPLLGGSNEKGVVKAGQGAGTTSSGDSYITLGKFHDGWDNWDEDNEDDE